jgi:hypothetical protein
MAGTYHEKIDIDVSGTPGNYITIRNYQNDEVIIDAIHFNDDTPIIWTDNAYLQIEGLHLTNNIHNDASGLMLQGAAHHIKIINNKISNIKFSPDPNAPVNDTTNAVPLSIYADHPTDSIHHIVIRGNEVFNNRTGYSENISCDGNFTNFLIEDNIIHDNTNIGIDIAGNYGTSPNPATDHGRNGIIKHNLIYNCRSPYSQAAGIYIDGGWNIIVENNICHHNDYGGEIGCEEDGETKDVIFRNNIFYHNYYSGMHIGGYDPNTTGIVRNASVFNNTFYKNDLDNTYGGEITFTQSENCRVENNIFYMTTQNVFATFQRTQTNLSLDYNLVFNDDGPSAVECDINGTTYQGLQNFYAATGYGNHSVYGNPLFTDANTFDFHIRNGSPAINSGNPAYVPGDNETDMDGESRVNDGIVDCGADEFHANTSISITTNDPLLFYPNPATDFILIKNMSGNTEYEIFDRTGKTLYKGKTDNGKIKITFLPAGFFIIVLKKPASGKILSGKLIKR